MWKEVLELEKRGGRGILFALRAAGKRVDVLAKCHVAVQNFGPGAQTLDHWVRRQPRAGRCSADVLVIEELSQVSAYLWNDLAKCALAGVQWILLGDFKQFSAIMDTWCGTPVRQGAVQCSDLLHEITGGVRTQLVERKRSDERLFRFYTGLWNPGVVLSQVLLEARAKFPVKQTIPRYRLCISHARRVALNRSANLREKPPHARFVSGPEPFYCWPGQQLVGCGHACKRGLFYSVQGVDSTHVHLEGLSLKNETAGKSLRPCAALVYSSVQGLTLPGTVRLQETDHRHFTLTHLYIGASRAVAHDLLEIA